jgi:hypothetical protein
LAPPMMCALAVSLVVKKRMHSQRHLHQLRFRFPDVVFCCHECFFPFAKAGLTTNCSIKTSVN